MTLTCLESLITVPLGRQRELDLLFVYLVKLSDLLELLRSILVNGYLLVDSKHGGLMIARPRLLSVGIFLLYLSLLDEPITNKVLELSFVPLLRVLDLDSVETTDPHQVVRVSILPLHLLL